MGIVAEALRKARKDIMSRRADEPPGPGAGKQHPAPQPAARSLETKAPAPAPTQLRSTTPVAGKLTSAVPAAKAAARPLPQPAATPSARAARPPQPRGEVAPAAKSAAPPAQVIPVPERVARDLVSLLDPDGPEAELFKLLRTRILFPPNGTPARTILVTSAVSEEGKSFVAANLAVNMAKNVDEHVLLVDCDLRKPSIHAKFGYNGVKGLSDYLARGLALPELLLKTGVQKLTLLTSGAPPPNPSELVTSARMAALIAELKARYQDRYIIIDSPPPLMTSETAAIAKWVDGIIIVVKYGTSMELVEELMSQLEREKVMGVVVNQMDRREFRRYTYKKYYGGSRYYSAARG